MKISFLHALFLSLVLLVMVSGCIGGTSGEEKAIQKQEVHIAGSGSGADILKPLAAAFEKKNPQVAIVFLPPTSTGDGITGAGEGTIDIGSIARKMKNSEKAKYPDLQETIYVKDAMILAVNPQMNVSGLTGDEIRGIHAGNISDWSKLGGQEGAIILLDREESESSKQILREKIIGNITITPKAVMMYSSNVTNAAIEENAFAIGQSSLGTIKMNGLNIKPLAIDGVMPTPDTVRSGEYAMVRDYGIVYKRGGASEATEKFVDFIFSSEAVGILSGYGFVPVPR